MNKQAKKKKKITNPAMKITNYARKCGRNYEGLKNINITLMELNLCQIYVKNSRYITLSQI